MAHTHKVIDTDRHFIINANSGEITTNSRKLKLKQYDHQSRVFTFEIPRYIDGHDMLLCDQIQIHYSNIGDEQRVDNVYEVTDLRTKTDNGEVLIFSWLISSNVTSQVGTINFTIRFSCTADGIADYVWNTTICSLIQVVGSIYNTSSVVDQYPDTFAQINQRLERLENQEDSEQSSFTTSVNIDISTTTGSDGELQHNILSAKSNSSNGNSNNIPLVNENSDKSFSKLISEVESLFSSGGSVYLTLISDKKRIPVTVKLEYDRTIGYCKGFTLEGYDFRYDLDNSNNDNLYYWRIHVDFTTSNVYRININSR